MSTLTLGTAKISTDARGVVILTYMNIGSFLVGRGAYRNEAEAREFCADHGLRVLR